MPADILELIKTGSSIRKYKTAPVSEEEINKILEAGSGHPSVNRCQPWRYYRCGRRRRIKKM